MKKLLFFCSLLLGTFSLSAQVSCLEHDSLELVKIYNACDGANWNTTWDLNAPVRTWHEITLTADGCGVEVICLGENNISGSFPDIDLSSLTKLYLLNNELVTEIPDFSYLSNLEDLVLVGNQLTTVPDFQNLTNLTRLWVHRNPLTTIPDFSNLTNLKKLSVGESQLKTVPDFSNLSSLTRLNISYAQLTEIPDFSNLGNLLYLYIRANELTEVPDFSNLGSLTEFSLTDNQLTTAPNFSNLKNLERLSFSENQLTEVPDFSNLRNLYALYIYGNPLTTVPNFSNLDSLKWLFLQSDRLNFSEIMPFAGLDSLVYTPQDSIALSHDNNNLVFNTGGNLADNTYFWYRDTILLAMTTGANTFIPIGSGTYRCEATNTQLPDLKLYSKEINICDNTVLSSNLFYDINTVFPPYCPDDELSFRVYGPLQSRYQYFVNGQIEQDSSSSIFTTNKLSPNDYLHVIVEDQQGCQSITDGITIDIHPEIDLLICQENPAQFNVKLQQGTPPWSFNLVEYEQGIEVRSAIYSITSTDIDFARNPNSYYEIIGVADDNCSSKEIFKVPKITGCAAVCVGYSDPQVEYYRAKFFKPVTSGNITWEIFPADAVAQGDIVIISDTSDLILKLSFPNANPVNSEILLRATAQTDCGIEILEFPLLLDQNCVWPGDVNNDGQVTLNDAGIPWIGDAVGLARAISLKNAIEDSQNNESLISYPRPIGCLAEKTYDWVPQSAKDWKRDSAGIISPIDFQILDNDNNITATFNFKYADANGDGILSQDRDWNPDNEEFDTLSSYSDIDVIAYHEYLGSTHSGNAPSLLKMIDLPELITITAPDSVLANGDEIVFTATIGSPDNVIDSVVQVAFQAEGAFGTYRRPAIELPSSHLTMNSNDMVDYPFIIPNFQGVESDSLKWLVSMHSPNFVPVTFAGEVLCEARCHVVVVGLQDDYTPQSKNWKNSNDSLGIPRRFKITAGLLLEDGRTKNVQSNEITVYIKPDPLLAAKVVLEGAYEENTNLMRDDLRLEQLIPDAEPYSSLVGSTYFPKEELKNIGMKDAVLSITGQEAIVDWVLIEVWQYSTLYCRRPALLTRSGDVVDMDGVSPVPMNRVPYGDYSIVLRHRNHLPAITSTAVSLERGITTLDFITMANSEQKEIAPNRYAMYAGDATCEEDYNIHGKDKIEWQINNGLYGVYNQADFDLNSDVNGLDRILWEKNNGVFSIVPY